MNLKILFFSILSIILINSIAIYYIWRPRRFDISIFDNINDKDYNKDNICLQSLADLNSHLLYQRHFIHGDYINLLPCVLDLNYNFGSDFHVIIIGSTSSVGISLMKMLKEYNIEYVEVRNRIHFNMLRDPIWEIFDQMQNNILIFDFQHIYDEYATKKLNLYAKKRKIPIVRLVSSFLNDNYSYQIQVPMVFGPNYQRISDCVNSFYYDCFINNTQQNYDCSPSIQYVLSYDLAKYLFENLEPVPNPNFSKPMHIIPDIQYYSSNEIISHISKIKPQCKCKNSENDNKEEENRSQNESQQNAHKNERQQQSKQQQTTNQQQNKQEQTTNQQQQSKQQQQQQNKQQQRKNDQQITRQLPPSRQQGKDKLQQKNGTQELRNKQRDRNENQQQSAKQAEKQTQKEFTNQESQSKEQFSKGNSPNSNTNNAELNLHLANESIIEHPSLLEIRNVNSNSDDRQMKLAESFSHVDSSFNSIIPDLSAPYVSHITTISDLPRVVSYHQIVMNTVSQILPQFPLINVEFITIYTSSKDTKFSDLYEIPPNLAKYHKEVNIPSRILKEINRRLKSKHFPEYVLRNIGVRRAKGVYIIAGSSDVLMPPGFFISAEQLLFSPLTIIRSVRENVMPVEVPLVMKDFSKYFYSITYWAHTDIGVNQMKLSLLCDASGDFQGCHRLMWEAVNGYVESTLIFNVDSAFEFDLCRLMTPIMIRFLPGEKHLIHTVISVNTPHLHLLDLYNRFYVYNGWMSWHENYRPNWGYGNLNN